MADKRIVLVSDGPQGPSILYDDGSTEAFPVKDVEPPPLTGDIAFEETRMGFEVWYSVRSAREHQDSIEKSAEWLLERPEVVGVLHDDDQVVQVTGKLDDALKTDLMAWWSHRVERLEPS
jgi:hypothetical protein